MVVCCCVAEGLVRNAEMEMQARESEIALLKQQLAEESRQVELLKKRLPERKKIADELVCLQIQVIALAEYSLIYIYIYIYIYV